MEDREREKGGEVGFASARTAVYRVRERTSDKGPGPPLDFAPAELVSCPKDDNVQKYHCCSIPTATDVVVVAVVFSGGLLLLLLRLLMLSWWWCCCCCCCCCWCCLLLLGWMPVEGLGTLPGGRETMGDTQRGKEPQHPSHNIPPPQQNTPSTTTTHAAPSSHPTTAVAKRPPLPPAASTPPHHPHQIKTPQAQAQQGFPLILLVF